MLSPIQEASFAAERPYATVVVEFGEILHGVGASAKMICVLTAYLDESGIHADSRICAIAGFVGALEEWDLLERRWNAALGAQGVQCFHMARFESRIGEFSSWSNSRREDFLGELVEIMKAREIYSVGSGVVVEDFRKLPESDRQWMTHGNPNTPYFLCFQHCIVEAAHHGDSLPANEKVAFVFDRQDSFSAEATRLYNRMKDDIKWDNRVRLADTVAFASKLSCAPLQVADFAAYETYKQLENKLYRPELGVRWPIRQFHARPFCGRYFTSEALRDLINTRVR